MDTTTDTIVNQQASWFTFVACNADLFSAPSVLQCVYWGDGVEGYREKPGCGFLLNVLSFPGVDLRSQYLHTFESSPGGA